MLFHRELAANLNVCRHCGHHLRIGAVTRLNLLFDDGLWTRVELPQPPADPLRFRDRKRYAERLREAQAVYGPGSDAVVVAHGRLDGHRRRGGAGDRGALGGAAGGGADRRAGLGRRPHAGGRAVADADAAHDPCRRYGQGGRPSLHRAVDRSDDGRRLRLLCDGRRHHAGRARRDHRFCRRPRHRRDDPREIAARFSARRISLRARHGRPGRTARRAARHAGARDRAAARAGGRGGVVSERPQARSDRVLARLMRLHPKRIDLSLGRIERLLAALGNPEERLPPVVHVAGTNGKGSVVATLRACLEAGGWRVHAYTSPHLVRFHERIRLAGALIEEEALVALLEECERANGAAPITFFEITTAAAFLAFARTPADIVLLETGLGGRLDATNLVRRPAATAITPISLDHQAFLGPTIAAIAGEKAGILKPGAP